MDRIYVALAVAIVMALALLYLSRRGRYSIEWFGTLSWPILRQVIGWLFILLGLAGMVLPLLQGVLFLAIGIAILGRRNPIIRRVRLLVKLRLRRWKRQAGVRGWLGQRGLSAMYKVGAKMRDIAARFRARIQKVS